MKRTSCQFLLLALLGLQAPLVDLGCVRPMPDGDPPIEPLELEMRTALEVAETRNQSPVPVVAQLTSATHDLLIQVLERSKRFRVVDGDRQPHYRLHTSILEFRDEDASEGVRYGFTDRASSRRRAVVELKYQLLGPAEQVFLEGVVSGDVLQLGVTELVLPGTVSLETGAFWNTPFGQATRICVDRVVREISQVL